MKKQTVYLDMDGTIADLYGEPNWLDDLRSEKEGVFLRLRPLTDEKTLLEKFPKDKYKIVISSMTPKDASPRYCDVVKKEKELWLSKFYPSIKHKIFMKYGVNKNVKNSKNAILIDDNEKIRYNFKGEALHPEIIW